MAPPAVGTTNPDKKRPANDSASDSPAANSQESAQSKGVPIAAVAIPIVVLLVAAIAAGVYMVRRRGQQPQPQPQQPAYGFGMPPGRAPSVQPAGFYAQPPPGVMPQHMPAPMPHGGGGYPQYPPTRV